MHKDINFCQGPANNSPCPWQLEQDFLSDILDWYHNIDPVIYKYLFAPSALALHDMFTAKTNVKD